MSAHATRRPAPCAARILALLLPLLLSGGLGCSPEPACPSGNLLGPDTPLRSQGVMREEWMADGLAPAGEMRQLESVAYFVGPRGEVTWDLGRLTAIAAVQVVTNNDAATLISLSADGKAFRNVPLESESGPHKPGQLFVRFGRLEDPRARYVRIAMGPSERGRAVGEVLAFCQEPADLPVAIAVAEPPEERAARIRARGALVNGARVGLAFALALGAIVFRRKLTAYPRAVAVVAIAIGAIAWLRFGDGIGDGELIHPWDVTHYYLGSKYFPELGYTELYRCIAKHERQSGRGALVDRGRVRDLDNNVLYRGSWTATADGACRADFSPARWRAFREDTDRIRRSFGVSKFHKALEDHGYNATPIHTAWLHPLTSQVPSTRAGLTALAIVDLLTVTAVLAAFWWAFGPLSAGLAMLVLGLGTPWSVLWIGGSIGRFAWIVLLCTGFALLKKERFAGGAALVTFAGLLRLFPMVFVAALGLKMGIDLLRERALGVPARRMLAGIAAAVGVGMAAAVVQGLGDIQAFLDNSALHALVPPKANHVGLGVLASMGSAGSVVEALRLGDWSAPVLWGSLAWGLGVLAAGAFLLVNGVRRDRAAWETLWLATPLLFASLPLAGYDAPWLLLLVPVCAKHSTRAALLLGMLGAVDLAMATDATLGEQHLVVSGLIAVLLVAICWHEHLDPTGPSPPARLTR